MFKRLKEKRETKKISEILHERILKAEKIYKPHGKRILIWILPRRFDPFLPPKIAIKGVSSATKVGAAASLPSGLVYQAAAKVLLDIFEEYFKDTFLANVTSKRAPSDALSHYLVKDSTASSKYHGNIAAMRLSIYTTIYTIAEIVEDKDITLETAKTLEIDQYKKQQIITFGNAWSRWKISYRAVATALTLFVQENANIVARYESARRKRPAEARRLLQLNAVFCYEVADVIVSFLRSFELQGVPELKSLHGEIMKEVDRGRMHLDNLETESSSSHQTGVITKERLDKTTATIAARRRAFELIDSEWDKLLEKLSDSEQNSIRFDRIIQKLEMIKHDAQANLALGVVMDLSDAVRGNFDALGGMIAHIDNLEIASITDEDVAVFLNLGIKDPVSSSSAITI